MEEIKVTLPDGSLQSYPVGTTPLQVAESIGKRLAKDAIAARVDGKQVDLTYPLQEDCELAIITVNSDEGHEILLHSTSHLMAQAVKQLFPDTQVTIGPAIEDGFYYDFAVEEPFSEDDLQDIENRMHELAEENISVHRIEKPIDETISFFRDLGEDYKVEILDGIKEEEGDTVVSMYQQDDFIDLCRGPHVPSTGKLQHFKLLKVAGAYWRGDEKNEMLQRIYGTSWPTEKELNAYLKRLEEAKERDHRKLGKELDLFSFHTVAPASPFFHPKGTVIYNELVNYIRELYVKYDYQEVITPQILDVDLWHKSGHYDNYKENMYFTSQKDEKREYAVKPMNCPTHTLIYKVHKHSYRDLPLRIADFGRLHRYEPSGVTSGLTRVRSFSQDDAHIFCTVDQVEGEVLQMVEMILDLYNLFGFEDVEIEISTRPEKFIGEIAVWDEAEAILKKSLDSKDYTYDINEGDGAFYGPKIDFIARDALKRAWQLGTVQLDFMMPERLDLTYTSPSGDEKRPVMVHRAILGSLERFIGILFEHTNGELPLWLAPVQFSLLPITDDHQHFAHQVKDKFQLAGLRVEVDDRSEKVGAKIREAELQKVPYMGIIGDREVENNTISLRKHKIGDIGTFKVNEVLIKLSEEIATKQLSKTQPEEDNSV